MLGRGEVAFPFKFASFSLSIIGTRVFTCEEHCVPSSFIEIEQGQARDSSRRTFILVTIKYRRELNRRMNNVYRKGDL